MLSTLLALLVSVLPQWGTVCQSALEVSREIGCRYVPAPGRCYATVVAQYGEGQAVAQLVEAADCEPADPGCQAAGVACVLDPSGLAFPMLGPGDTTASCQNDAAQEGLGYPESCLACWRMIDRYGDTDPDAPGCM